eukprot:g648.t1
MSVPSPLPLSGDVPAGLGPGGALGAATAKALAKPHAAEAPLNGLLSAYADADASPTTAGEVADAGAVGSSKPVAAEGDEERARSPGLEVDVKAGPVEAAPAEAAPAEAPAEPAEPPAVPDMLQVLGNAEIPEAPALDAKAPEVATKPPDKVSSLLGMFERSFETAQAALPTPPPFDPLAALDLLGPNPFGLLETELPDPPPEAKRRKIDGGKRVYVVRHGEGEHQLKGYVHPKGYGLGPDLTELGAGRAERS